MKKVNIDASCGQCTCSLYFEQFNDMYRLFVGISTADALFETVLDLDVKEIRRIINMYNSVIKRKEECSEWKNISQEFILRLSLDVDNKLNCSIDIAKDNFQGHFEFLVSPDVSIEEEDCSLLFQNKFMPSGLDVCKVDSKIDSTDFCLVYESKNFKIQKNFWVYDFECNEICQQQQMFLSTGKEVKISINDSFLWIHICQNNRMEIEFDMMSLPSSSIKCEFPITHLDIERILAAML